MYIVNKNKIISNKRVYIFDYIVAPGLPFLLFRLRTNMLMAMANKMTMTLYMYVYAHGELIAHTNKYVHI